MGFDYASDVRGESACYPVFNGGKSNGLQIPTTRPTLDELIGVDDVTEENVDETVFALSRSEITNGHVYTLHAELEGMKLLPLLRKLITQWQANGQEVVATEAIYQGLNKEFLPQYEIVMGELEGRSGVLALPGTRI